MALYYIKCRGQVDETYAVDADSQELAMSKWSEGILVNSESWDVLPMSVELADQ